MYENIFKYIMSIVGLTIGYFKPSVIYIIIGILLIILDNIFAWKANKRVKLKYPNKVKNSKYKSIKAAKTLKKISHFCILILVSYIIDTEIVSKITSIQLTAIVSCVYCFVEICSILENYNTANDNPSRFVELLRKIVIDKSERYFDIDLDNDNKVGKGQ